VSDLQLEHVACALCGSSEKDVLYKQIVPYQVVRCRSCGLFYLSPRLPESAMMEHYFDSNYFEGGASGYTSYSSEEASLRATFRQFLRKLREYRLTGGSLLEVGCGYGYLLDEAKGFFDVRVGTDFSDEAVKRARLTADHVYRGGIEQVPADMVFDCIIATQVIEHVYHPKEFLDQLKEHLTLGGKVVFATCDMGSLWRRLMGHRWPSFKLPEHIHYFDRASLYRLMHQNGLVNIDFIPYPHAFSMPLVASKFLLRLPSIFHGYYLWIPGTTIAAYGFSDDRSIHK
jgi:SAM-dependent methyltransferase